MRVGNGFHERLQMQEPDLCHDRILKLMPRYEKCINVLGAHDEE
jgi:hypothetical protein